MCSLIKQTAIPKIFRHLTFYVLAALLLAVLLGYFYPATAVRAGWMGTKFVDLIKLFIPPIIFLTIVTGISGMSDLKKVGRIGLKSLLYFEVVTTVSLAVGILLASIFEPGHIGKNGLAVSDASKYTAHPAGGLNWAQFFSSNLTLQVLVAAIVVGI